MNLQIKQEFDPNQKRHYTNGECYVLHCHHYSALFTQLADDAKDLDGPNQLRNAFAEAIYPILQKYYQENAVTAISDRLAVAEEYCIFSGLGKIKITLEGNQGKAEMIHSHIDEGWIKKFGKRDHAINYIGQGFLDAVFSAVTGNAIHSFKVEETQSIVCGAPTSQFTIAKA